MKLVQVTLEGALELEGTLDFPPNKIVVLYGANQQGKTNIVNAIRYAFLKEVESKRKSKLRYDDWVLPSSQEIAPTNRTARIQILFEANSVRYRLLRNISSNGRDSPVLTRLNDQHRTEERIDLPTFLRENLKAGLLDALFAPEIAGGFKRLYGRDIDESIALMFKEITTTRLLSTRFTERLERMHKGADAELSRIKADYTTCLNEMLKTCDNLKKMSEYTHLLPYQPGTTILKIEALSNALRTKVTGLKQDELLTSVDAMLTKTKTLKTLNEKLQQCPQVENSLKVLDEVTSDKEKLHGYLDTLSHVTDFKDEVGEPPTFTDSEVTTKATLAYDKFKTAKSLLQEAKHEAHKLGINLESINEEIDGCSAVVKVLRQKQRAGREEDASVTKIGQKAYTVIPIEVLREDPTFTLLNKQPIPKGADEDKREYLKQQTHRLKKLKTTAKKEKDAELHLETFVKKSRPTLSQIEEQLRIKIDELRQAIDGWRLEIANSMSAFTGEQFEIPKRIERVEEISRISNDTQREIGKKTQEYLSNLNERVSQIGLTLVSFDEHSVSKLLTELRKEKLQIPQYEKAIKFIDENKETWRVNDEAYVDYRAVPTIVSEASAVFHAFLDRCIDEKELKKAIIATFNEIITEMRHRKLIEAFPEVSTESLQVNVKYKDKEITHPAGSEKAFFSLAILTALGHYFQMPILIDEVANNLDQNNLPSFFHMALEQKSRRAIQYLLSIKQTQDFDLDGWVKAIADEVEIYELDGKKIQKKSLL